MERKSHRGYITAAMMVATLLSAIDVTVVSTAMPRIVADLGGLQLMSWVFAIYTLTTCVTTPIYGKLSDLFGRKRIFQFGLILFVLGSVLSGMAHSMVTLILFRAIQGLGAGSVTPVTLTIIGDLYPGEERAKVQGLFAAVWGVSGILGPLVGGLFTDHLSWRWIFYINLPVGIIAFLMVQAFLHEHAQHKQHKIDYAGAISFVIAMTALMYGLLSVGHDFAWGSTEMIGLMAIALAGFIAFVFIEARAAEPILPLSLFRSPIISVSNASSFLANAVFIATSAYIPLWLQGVKGFTATGSGLTLIPTSLAWPVASMVVAKALYKLGPRPTTWFAILLVALGALWLMFVNASTPVWIFIAIMIIMGFGMGFSTTPFTVLIQSAVTFRQRGTATASSTFVRSLGQTVGVAVYGTVFNQTLLQTTNTASQRVSLNDVNKLLNSQTASLVPPRLLPTIHHILVSSLHSVFVVALVTAVVSLAVIAFMPSSFPTADQDERAAQNAASNA